ncbi:hypothetical protein L1887_06108 [Cichorium endivia]|nr:hypothetical protein L1887_06108 [Cichorium endivia]
MVAWSAITSAINRTAVSMEGGGVASWAITSPSIKPINKSAIHKICAGQVILDLPPPLRKWSRTVWMPAPLALRGEALSALCYLGDLTVETRTKSEQVATHLTFGRSGLLIDERKTATPSWYHCNCQEVVLQLACEKQRISVWKVDLSTEFYQRQNFQLNRKLGAIVGSIQLQVTTLEIIGSRHHTTQSVVKGIDSPQSSGAVQSLFTRGSSDTSLSELPVLRNAKNHHLDSTFAKPSDDCTLMGAYKTDTCHSVCPPRPRVRTDLLL